MSFRNILIPAFCLFAGISGLSAQHRYYLPNRTQVPVLKQRHDAGVEIGWSQVASYTGWELQGHYSPLKRFVVTAGLLHSGRNQVTTQNYSGLKYRFYELGCGLYDVYKHGSGSLLAGVSWSEMYHAYGGGEYARLNFSRVYVQPGLGYRDEFFQGGLAIRLSYLSFGKGSVDLGAPPEDLALIRQIEENSPVFIPELGVNSGVLLGPFSLNISIAAVYGNTGQQYFARLSTCIYAGVNLSKLRGMKQKKSPENI